MAGLRLLMVCTGNICRSPTMEAVFRHFAKEAGRALAVDSAGIQGWHAGEPPDPRTVATALARGYDLSHLRARRVVPDDFMRFDLILAADRGHMEELARRAPAEARPKIRLFLGNADLADPYYGGQEGFERVLDEVKARAGEWDGSTGFFRG